VYCFLLFKTPDRYQIRGKSYKLLNHTFHYDLQKHFFSACVVNIWNNLPNSVVNASTVNAFKARLDTFWSHQAVKFYFTADLTGIETDLSQLYIDNVFITLFVNIDTMTDFIEHSCSLKAE